jgi:ketosteroid isomerase-like protein
MATKAVAIIHRRTVIRGSRIVEARGRGRLELEGDREGDKLAMKERCEAKSDETELRELLARWAKAVRDENLAGIRADHDPDMLMFDVPPPFLSRGLDAYMATWPTFFKWQAKPVEFDFHDVEITAGQDVAFATAIGRCGDTSSGKKVDLEFRLTIGFRKLNGCWRIVHEHHSIPATDAGV